MLYPREGFVSEPGLLVLPSKNIRLLVTSVEKIAPQVEPETRILCLGHLSHFNSGNNISLGDGRHVQQINTDEGILDRSKIRIFDTRLSLL
jgi:hypothetical protein